MDARERMSDDYLGPLSGTPQARSGASRFARATLTKSVLSAGAGCRGRGARVCRRDVSRRVVRPGLQRRRVIWRYQPRCGSSRRLTPRAGRVCVAAAQRGARCVGVELDETACGRATAAVEAGASRHAACGFALRSPRLTAPFSARAPQPAWRLLCASCTVTRWRLISQTQLLFFCTYCRKEMRVSLLSWRPSYARGLGL